MINKNQASRELLDLFFPIHYLVGIRIEDALKSDVLTRQQACILWTIRAEGENGTVMRRKDIEAALTKWYEAKSSAISKSLRAMTRPPFDLLKMTEDPMNGREKFVSLTPKGKQYVTTMIANGIDLMDAMVERLTDEEIVTGIHFLKRVTDITEEIKAIEDTNPISKNEL